MSNVTMTAHQRTPFLGVDQVGPLYFFRPEAEYFTKGDRITS